MQQGGMVEDLEDFSVFEDPEQQAPHPHPLAQHPPPSSPSLAAAGAGFGTQHQGAHAAPGQPEQPPLPRYPLADRTAQEWEGYYRALVRGSLPVHPPDRCACTDLAPQGLPAGHESKRQRTPPPNRQPPATV